MAIKPAKCPKCDSLIEVDDVQRIIQCNHCKKSVYVATTLDYFKKSYGVIYTDNVCEEISKNEDFDAADGVLIAYHGSSFDVVIPEGVTKLAKRCLREVAVKKVTLPGSVKEYTEGFSSNPTLEEAVLSQGVETVPEEAFCACRVLRTVNLPSTLKEIGAYAFAATGIIEIDIPEGVTRIGDRAFASCTALERVSFPTTLKEIGANAFEGCKKLGEIYLPRGLEAMGKNAFIDCSKAERIALPSALETVPEGAFSGCKEIVEVLIPDGVVAVGDGAFAGCKGIMKVTAASSVKKIGEGAFAASPVTEGLILPEGVTFGEKAFKTYWRRNGLCGKCGGPISGKKCKVCG